MAWSSTRNTRNGRTVVLSSPSTGVGSSVMSLTCLSRRKRRHA
jgi:hypothetical protein